MKTCRLNRQILLTALLLMLSGTAQAQFNVGKLANRAKNAVKSKVEQTAKQTAKQTTEQVQESVPASMLTATRQVEQKANPLPDKEPEYRTLSKAPDLGQYPSIDEIYLALDYWMSNHEAATAQKDLEWLTDPANRQLSDCMNRLSNDERKEQATKHKYQTSEARFREVMKRANDLIYEGQPEYSGVESLPAVMRWALDKARAGGPKARSFYILNGASMRQLCYSSGRYAESEAVEQVNKEYLPLWDELPEETKKKYANSNPHFSYTEIQTRQAAATKAYNERMAREKAEREARLEASKQTLKPGSMHASMASSVLAVAKLQEPRCERVVVISNAWTVRRRGGVITHRTITAWVVYRNQEGQLVATDHMFAQSYEGGGRYGKLRHEGVGLSTVLVK